MNLLYENMESNSAVVNNLASGSKSRYKKTYQDFQKWIKLKGETTITEDILLTYFSEIGEKNKPTTLWAYHSMLKATLKVNDQIDISTFTKLTNFVKSKNIGYQPVKPKMFTLEEVAKFINEAKDEYWLDVKVACAFGVCGAYSSRRLTNVMIQHVRQCDDFFLVTIPKTDSGPQRSFTIAGDYFNVVKKYSALRPSHAHHDRFFIRYENGRCTIQTIGKNTFNNMPRKIAKFLSLPEHERYTSISFSQTAARIPGNNTIHSVANDIQLKYVNGTPERYTVRSVKSVPSPINTISASADHVCNLNCGQVKCASEAHVNDVFHAFNIFKSSEYTVEDVTPALFTSKPTCRWIVAYKHNSEPINYDNSDEKFEDITRSTPNNVKAIENFVRMNSVQSFAAYVVIYGVNCRCQKRNVNISVPTVKRKVAINSFESPVDAINCEPEDLMDTFEYSLDAVKREEPLDIYES